MTETERVIDLYHRTKKYAEDTAAAMKQAAAAFADAQQQLADHLLPEGFAPSAPCGIWADGKLYIVQRSSLGIVNVQIHGAAAKAVATEA